MSIETNAPEISAGEISRARKLHSMLLFDFIVVHIFVFLIAVSMIKSSLIPIILMPLLSISMIIFILFQAQRARSNEASFFVRAHMLLAAKRAKLFLGLFIVTGTFTAAVLLGGHQLGMSKVSSYALAGGIGQLPFMVALLALVILEFDADHQAKAGKIPAAALKLLPAAAQA